MKTKLRSVKKGSKKAATPQAQIPQGSVTETAVPPRTQAKKVPVQFICTEFKLVAMRECPTPGELHCCDTPSKAADYWRLNIAGHPYYNPECECFVVLILNIRRNPRGHMLVSTGTMDTVLAHPREVFRGAIMAGASAVILMHNHPSGDPSPSPADIKVTGQMRRAGEILGIEVLDHVIVGDSSQCPAHPYASLRELGHFLN